MTDRLEELYLSKLEFSNISIPSHLSRGYVILSGPPPDATTAWKGIDKEPTLYLFGGVLEDGTANTYVYVLQNKNTRFKRYHNIQIHLTDCKGCYVPQYKKIRKQLGIFILTSKIEGHVISFDIKQSAVQVLPSLPPEFKGVTTMAVEFLDDVSGPLYVMLDKQHPKFATTLADKYGSCARNRNIWFTEGSKYWYLNTDESGTILGGWNNGPSIPYPVDNFQFGRVFLRHQNTHWDIEICAMLCIYGGILKDTKQITNKVQFLVNKGKVPNITYSVITDTHNKDTTVPDTLLTLPEGIHSGIGLTAQWPEMLITGDRCICVGYNKDNVVKMFMTELRFGTTPFGDQYKWQTLDFPKVSKLENIISAVPLDQHIPNLHFRKSNFLFALEDKKTMNLQLGPIQYYPAVESVIRPSTTEEAYNSFYKIYKSLATKDFTEWKKLFESGKSDLFIDMDRMQFVNNIGVPLSVSNNEEEDIHTFLYRSSWLGKVFIRDWANKDSILVSNKFTELGNSFFHPECKKSAGLNIAGKIIRYGISLMDKKPCWVLTYNCESGTHVLPTLPPIPIKMIRDELRYVKYMGMYIIVGVTYLVLGSHHKLQLLFALIPDKPLELIE